jgi:hypothetical protein
MGIFIPDVINNSASGGTICDHVTISGSTLTLLTSSSTACNANATQANNTAPIFHWSMTNGAITSSTNSLVVTAATTFLTGQGIRVAGAGTAGADLICAKITVSGTTFTLLQADGVTACNAGTTVSTGLVFHDDSYAMQQAAATGQNVQIPVGAFYLTSEVDFSSSASMIGQGRFQSVFITSKDNIKTFVAKANDITLNNFGIFQADSFTATAGSAVTTCASAIKCYGGNFDTLFIYRHWHQVDVVEATYRTHITNIQGIMAQSVAAYVNNPSPNGDIYWTNNHFDSCSNSSTCNTATGLLIDQSDAEWFVGDKFNTFKYGIRITGSIGRVQQQRFTGLSIEGTTTPANDFFIKIEKLAGNQVNDITFSGMEIGCCNNVSTANLMYVGNSVTDVAVADSNILWTNGTSGATCIQIDGQSVAITGNVFYHCNDGVSLGATAANVSISGNSFHSLNGTGISGTTGASHISTVNNTFSAVSNGNIFLPPGSQDPTTIGTLWDGAKSLTISSDVKGGASADNFDRPNGVAGSNWTTYRGTFAVTDDQLAYTATPGNEGMMAWTGASFNSDQHSRITAAKATANSTDYGPAVRIQSAGNNAFYWATVDTGTTFILYVSNPSTGTTTTVASVAGGWAVGDILDLTVVGTTLTLYKNGTNILSGTDANLSGGAPGVAVSTATVPQSLMDNWTGGNTGDDATILSQNNSKLNISSGIGARSGSCTAPAFFIRSDGGANTSFYVCEGGTWAAK